MIPDPRSAPDDTDLPLTEPDPPGDDFENEEPTPGSDGDGAEAGYTPPSESDPGPPEP